MQIEPLFFSQSVVTSSHGVNVNLNVGKEKGGVFMVEVDFIKIEVKLKKKSSVKEPQKKS